MWQRFTERARRVILLGQEEALNTASGHVGTEHLLIGLLREDEGAGAKVLQKMGITLEAVRAEVQAQTRGDEREIDSEPKLTPAAKRVLELCADVARRMGHHHIGTEHMLVALLRVKGMAATVLKHLGLNLDAVRAEIISVLVLASTQDATRQIQEQPERMRSEPEAEFIEPEAEFIQILDAAINEAKRMGYASVKCEHLLLALLEHQRELLADVVGEFDAEVWRARLRQRLNDRQV